MCFFTNVDCGGGGVRVRDGVGVSDASWEEEVNLTEEWVCRGGAEGITLINIALILFLWRGFYRSIIKLLFIC